jgi:anti-anti-sigma factor
MEGHFAFHESRNILIVEVLVNRFDFLELSEYSGYLRNILEKRHFPSAIFDLRKVTFIDSSVFGFLLEVHNKTQKHGNKIAIVCADNAVLRVIALLTMSDIINIFQTIEQAMEYLNIK